MSLGQRLKEERERLELTVVAFAEAAGAKKNTVIDWQKDVSSPPAAKLSALAEIGVDVLFVITGRREMDIKKPSSTERDSDRLTIAIEAVNEGLAETGRTLPPRKLAELILAAYELIADPIQSRDNIIKLVRMAA